MSAPEEVIAYPLTVFAAPVGTDFPAIDDLVADFDVAWIMVGTEGTDNIDDNGVTVSHGETINPFTPAGRTQATKYFRTEETVGIKFNLVDLGPIAYAMAMNDAEITTVAPSSGVAGEKSFSMLRGPTVAEWAILARGMSPVDNLLNQQYEFTKATMSVNGDVTYNKGVPAMLPLDIELTGDIINRIQTHAAS